MKKIINIEHDCLKSLLYTLKLLGYKWVDESPIDPSNPPSENIKSIEINDGKIMWSSITCFGEINELDFISQHQDIDGILYKINVPDLKQSVLHKLANLGYTWANGNKINPKDWYDKKIESIIAWKDKTITYSEFPIHHEDVISDSEFMSMEYNFVEPDHYKKGDKEVWEIMIDIYGEEKFNNFCLMNAFKYITRAGNKPGDDFKQDISKAVWYLNKLI
jgi:hypothetical protein